mgnify:FL=1|tara:strand:+ start:545 stop:730 length:186 start_codon:yes stop_codon:yes gene_type:complete
MHKKLNKNSLDNPIYQDVSYKEWVKEMLTSYDHNKQCDRFARKLNSFNSRNDIIKKFKIKN